MLNRMVEQQVDELSRVFRALGDPTRREMLHRLVSGERTVSELAEPFRMSLSAASKHIRVLERAGLIRRKVEGRTHRCRLEPGRLKEVHAWLLRYERYWAERLDELEALLEADDGEGVEEREGQERAR